MRRLRSHLYKRRARGGSAGLFTLRLSFSVGARERLAMLFDDGKLEELDAEVISIDRSNSSTQGLSGSTFAGEEELGLRRR